MLGAKALLGTVLLGSALFGLLGCAHGTAGAQYAVVDDSLVAGSDTLIDLGPPAATYDRSLITRDESQFLIHESFTNDKRVLLVELLPARVAGRVVSVQRNLMALDASGRPTWSGVELLDSGLALDDGFWDRGFGITDSLLAGEPDISSSLPGTIISIRTFKDGVAVGEHRMFSPTAPEAPVDVRRLGSVTRCTQRSSTGSRLRYAVATEDHAIIDVTLERSSNGAVRGSYRFSGESKTVPLAGTWNDGALVLESVDGRVLFEGQGHDSLFTGWWALTEQERIKAVLGCAEL